MQARASSAPTPAASPAVSRTRAGIQGGSRRRGGEALSALAAALVVALVAAAVVWAGGRLILEAGLARTEPRLEASTRAGAAAVGQAVAGQFARALALGIPLDRLPDLEPYLAHVVADSPQVAGLALLDADGTRLAGTAPSVTGDTVAIEAGGRRATLVVAAASPLIGAAMARLHAALALAALLAGALAGATVWGFLALSQQPARRRLRHALARAAEGDFARADPGEARGPFAAAAEALAARIERVEAARRTLAEAVATIRAIDFDGSLGRRIDPVLREVERRWTLRLPDDAPPLLPPAARAEAAPAMPDAPRAAAPAAAEAPDPVASPATEGAPWRLAATLAAAGACLPFVANFAVDRGTDLVAPAWAAVLPLLVEMLALALGAALGRGAAGRAPAARALALAAAGACIAAVFWCRSWELFMALRLGAGLGVGFAAGGLVAADARTAPRAARAMLVFACLLAGPLLAGLLGEAVGRRAGFLTLGAALVLASPLLAGRPGLRLPARGRTGRAAGLRPGRAAALAALCAFAAAATLAARLPLGAGYDDYLAGGGALAAFGAGALAAPALPGIAAALLLAASAAALQFLPPGAAAPAGALLMGFAFGACAPRRAERGTAGGGAGRATASVAAPAIGAAAGLLAAGVAPALAAAIGDAIGDAVGRLPALADRLAAAAGADAAAGLPDALFPALAALLALPALLLRRRS